MYPQLRTDRVKIVRSAGLGGLEDGINEFLATLSENSNMLDVKIGSGGQGYYAVITYCIWG